MINLEMEENEAIETIRQLHADNVRDVVAAIRSDSEFIAMKRIHKRNGIITKILRELDKK